MHTREQNGSKYPQKVKQQIKGGIIAIIVQEKEKAMRKAKVNSKKFIAVFTAVCMLLTFMPMSVAAAETDIVETAANPPAFQDVTGHWGQTAVEKWSGYGIINGYNGMFRPDDSITRGEMAVILDNLMDYQVAAENKFSDLKAGQFYTEAILKANAAGIIKGDGATVRPLDKITREESAVMMSRAFAVAESGSTMSFGDDSAVSSWAKGAVAGMESKGYVSGYAGNFDPKTKITRAAAVTMINNIVKAYYTKAGTYTDNVDGTAIIKVSDVILKGVTISGNLIIAEGVGKGDATLDNVTVKGETVVRGGGENSIHIIGNSSITSIRIEKIGDKLRIVIAEGASVKEVEVAVGEELIITGTVGTLEVNASNAVVYAIAAEITTATVNGDNSTIVVGAQSTINSVIISSSADNTAIKAETGSVVKSVEASATVAVTGTGTVSTVTLKTGADGSSVTTPKTVVPVSTGVTGVTGTGGTVIPAGSSGTNGTSATAPATVGGSTPPASSGGGGGGSSTVAVSAISVKGTGDATTITTDNGTLQMLPTVTPDNASNKAVTWTVTETDGTATDKAAISNTGLLTAVKNGTVKVTATAKDGSGKSGFANITITNQVGADKNITAVTTLIDKNVAYGTDLAGVSLPTTVGVTLEDSTTRNLAVTWNGGTPSYNGNTAGEYVFEGTLTLEAGVKNTSSLKATIKVIVAPQEKVAPPVITASTTTTTNRDAGVKFTVGTAAGVTFYYTLDGTTPTSSSTKYTGEVTVTAPDVDTVATVNIKVIGIKAGFINSDVVTKPVTYLAKGAATYAVTVTNGTGDGNYVEGATVTITANAADSGKVFDKWTITDGVTLVDANSASTTFTMPNKTVTVTATYKDIVVTGVTIKTPPTKTTYIKGETLNLTGLVVTLTKSDLSTEDVAFADFGTSITTSPENGTALSVVTTGVTITVNGKTVTQSITVTLPVMTGTVTITGDAKFGATLTANPSLTNAGTPTYQWNRGGVAISGVTASTYTLVEADITKTITVTVTAQESVGTGSITSDPTAVIEKADGPSAPAAPTEASKTDTSITLTANALHQFSKDSGSTWQDSPIFTGLNPSTEYTFVARIKATTTTKESAASSGITIKTTAPAPVSVTGVTLSQTTMSLKVGTGTGTLTATIAPANATNKTVTWESSNTSVATVDSNGKVTPLTVGETTITATTADGEKTATCTVTVTAANIATQVFVGGVGEPNTLKSDFPYWVNGERSKTGTLGSEGCTAFFDHLTGILTLRNYTGGAISSGLDSGKDFIVKLEGINTVNGASTGISNDGGGDIYITADNNATLNVITSSEDNFSYAIATGYNSGYPSGSVIIGGKAKVTVTATSTSYNKATGIQAGQGDVTIQEDARFTATLNADLTNGESIGIKTQKLIINTTGDIEIDCLNSKKGIVLYPSSLDIVNVNLMTLKAPTDGGFIFGTPVLPGVAVNEAGKVASYRSGTPYTIEVKNGEITGVAAGVIVQAGQPYQALANDTITIKSKTIPLFEFVKWMDAEGNDLDASLFTGGTTASSPEAKIKMPAKDLNIKAEYKSKLFVTQPSFHRGDAKVTWEISQAANGYLQKKNVGVWEGFGTLITSDIGVGNKVISSSQQPDGTYRLKLTISSAPVGFGDHYSEEFEILWDAQLAGTVTISGTPKSGETLTANVTGTQPDAGDLKYQWYAGTDKIGTNSNELALTTAQIGKTIKVAVSSHNYNLPIESAATVAVAKADGPAAIDSYTGTSEVEANIKLAGLGASTPNLEVAVAIDGSTYDEYRNLFVDGDGKASIYGLTGVNASTKVKVRIKESPTHFAGADREITVTVVADTTPPVITASDKILPIANLADWTETVWATDDVDGSISGNVVATYFQSDGSTSLTDLAAAKEYIGDASVNTSFIIKYNVSDAAGNAATEVVVTITVTEVNIPSSVTVGSSTLNSTNPYLVDGVAATEGTLGVGKCTAHFDPLTGVLSLQNYEGGEIRINEAGKDLSIKLIGNNNKITGGQFGIHNDKGDIHVTSDNEALLEIEIKSSSDGAAIANGWMTTTEKPSVFIGGKVKLTIKAEYTGEQTTNIITGIYAGRGSVIIQDQADYSATLTNSKYQGRGISSNGKTIINTSGNIGIDVSNSDQGVGINGMDGIEIRKVNSMLITIPSTGGTNTKFTSGTVDVSSGVAVNKSTTVASYRSGTPYTLGLEGGNITLATGEVIGSPHQYLVDDEITIESTISEFDRWTKANGAALETSLFTGGATANSSAATIKMPAESLNIKAREKETGTVIDIAAIPGVVAPVTGKTPVTIITETDQYTGTVTWSPTATKFAAETVYTATITLVAKSGYKLDGVAANYFTVAGATTVTNEEDTGEIIAVFPATEADTLIDIAAIPGVVAPVTGKTPVTKITETEQYTGTVAWTPANNPFAAETVYTATIKLTAKPGFKLDGVAANFFTVNGIATTHVAGVVTVGFPATAPFGFAGGTGTLGDPYKVATAEQLNKVREYMGSGIYFKQTADIDLSDYLAVGGAGYNEGKGWVPIGSSESSPFKGNYDGSGHTITGLTIVSTEDYQGLFGYGKQHTNLKNINLSGVDIKGKSFVGGLIGYFGFGQLENCYVSGKVEGTGNFVGGLAGLYNNSDVGKGMKNCSTSVEVIGNNNVGGLAGKSGYTTIDSCYSKGSVTGVDIVGGLVGNVASELNVKVTNSYSLASVTATGINGRVGGLVGLNQKAIENCYAAGQVTGNGTNAGGLVGENEGTITLSYYDIDTTGQSDTGKGDGKTTVDMKQAATFEGWDPTIWNIIDGSYPTLK